MDDRDLMPLGWTILIETVLSLIVILSFLPYLL